MLPYRQILARMRLGDSDRRIARSGVMDRPRLAALRRIAASAGWLDARIPLPDDTQLAAGLQVRHFPRTDAAARGEVSAAGVLACAGDGVTTSAARAPQPDEFRLRQAIDADQRSEDRPQLAAHLAALASLLGGHATRLIEAQQLAEAAVNISRTFNPSTPEPWQSYAVLAHILRLRAAVDADPQQRAQLEARAREFQQLSDFTPRFLHALASLADEAALARAVVSARLARCFYMSGHTARAITLLSDGLANLAALTPDDGVSALRGTLSSELGEILLASGEHEQARHAFGVALSTADRLQDIRAKGVSLSQLGALSLAEGNLAEALEYSRKALSLLRLIREPEVEATAWHQVATVLHQLQQDEQAERHYREAARLRDASADLRGGEQNGAPPSPRSGEPPFQITIHDEKVTDYGLPGNLLIDGPREYRVSGWSGTPQALSAEMHPMLAPCVRVSVESNGAIRFSLPFAEPVFERHGACTVIRRQCRHINISGCAATLWSLIRAADGSRSVVQMLRGVPSADRGIALHALGVLVATHALDVSGRAIGRFLHSATKKGVLAAGGLEEDEVVRLVTDGEHRVYPQAPRIDLSQRVPEALQALHSLTRARRSRRDFTGDSLSRNDFDALLHTACGMTGAMRWGAHEVKLRAYPSSGGLYAVEVYPVVLRVEQLAPGIYHYRSEDNCVELVHPRLDRQHFLEAMLPMERDMVAGIAVMFCLTGRFDRHERKYGEGGYRMLVAETGHISQNLILAAVALGLSARPFGGVFDTLVNEDLGLGDGNEQFLLSVLVGHAPAQASARSQ